MAGSPTAQEYVEYVKYCVTCIMGGAVAASAFVLQRAFEKSIRDLRNERTKSICRYQKRVKDTLMSYSGAKRRRDLATLYVVCRKQGDDRLLNGLELDLGRDKTGLTVWAVFLLVVLIAAIVVPLVLQHPPGFWSYLVPLEALFLSVAFALLAVLFWRDKMRRVRKKSRLEDAAQAPNFVHFSGKRTLLW